MAPLKKGHSREVISHNIKEMVSAGHPRTQAIAASLAKSRKYKKMWKGGMYDEGGEVSETLGEAIGYPGSTKPKPKAMADGGAVGQADEFDDQEEPMVPYSEGGMVDDETTLNENRMNSYSRVGDSEVENPEEIEEASMFAKALRKRAQMDGMSPENYAMGGLVQPEHDPNEGNKPSEDMNDETEEPMSSMPGRGQEAEHKMNVEPSGMGLSSEAKEALIRKKKSRRYVQM
jgi:hypothetical protein